MAHPKPPEICSTCTGWSWGCDGFSRVSGDNRIPLLFVGESSGATEAKRGEPFVGKAGQVLTKAFRDAGLSRNDYSITNLLRCKPPLNELKGASYERAALDSCRPLLDAAVAARHPRIIVALGDVPLRELCAVPATQSEHRGYVLPSIYEGVSIIGTFHPSRIARGDWHLFPVLKHDIAVAARYARAGIPEPLPTTYNLTPTLEQVEQYASMLAADLSLVLSYDCETEEILGLPGPSDWRKKRIVQMQFSHAVGQAIVLPYEGDYIPLAKYIMAMAHVKLSWNGRLSDDLLLLANGFTIGGESYDAMLMWSHLQPSFSSGKDAKDGDDKGVPSRLLNLQSATSFYYPYEPLYKTTMRAGIGHADAASWPEIRYGGARDTDLTLRLGLRYMRTLHSQGLWQGFYRYKHLLGQVLSDMSDRGLPIDRTEQRKLRQHIEWQQLILERGLQGLIPRELKPTKVYKGFPKDLREAVKAAGRWVKCCKPTEYPDLAESLGYECNGTLVKRLPFNADSPKQVLRYIEYCVAGEAAAFGHNSRWFIPLDIDTRKPSTNKVSIESLIVSTEDDALIQIRKLKKIGDLGAYCDGVWVPDATGRVHTEFRVGATATGQTSAVRPPIQTYPKHVDPADDWLVPTIKRIKKIIKAEAGHVMIEIDMTGFHAKVQGHLAGDVDYSRLASFDLHSYNVAHYLQLPDAHQLRLLDDNALRARLKEIKNEHSYERNFILKRIAFLRQFAGGAQKAATIMKISTVEVMAIFNMMDELFGPTFKDFPASIEKKLRESPRIVSPFGCQRWFWDGDIQQATAFLPANCAHCTIADALIRLHTQGAMERYGAMNFVHDSVWFHCPKELADECIEVVKREFERPSEVLISEKMGAFQCGAGASIGENMADMVDV